jgi:hypothetical protein
MCQIHISLADNHIPNINFSANKKSKWQKKSNQSKSRLFDIKNIV